MTTIQAKTIELQLQNFKTRVENWIDYKQFELDVNEWAVANDILTKYLKSDKIVNIENQDSSYDFHNAMNEIIDNFKANPISSKDVVEQVFRYISSENLVCDIQILEMIFPNISGETSVIYTIPMSIA